MSYIDCVPHEFCGLLASLPLYHPLADYTDPDEFCADPTQLVLGGGAGEHAGAVLSPVICAHQVVGDLVIAVLEAKDSTSDSEYAIFEANGLTEDSLMSVEGALESLIGKYNLASDYSSWTGLTWHGFVNGAAAWAGWRPFNEQEMGIESWIESSVGEFVLVSMPELLTSTYDELESYKPILRCIEAFLGRDPIYGNVLQFPTGYRVGGRGKSLGDPNMHY